MLDGLDQHQREAASAPLGPLAIIAGPGSGKTRTVVARISHLVSTGEVAAKEVLALTHTTKAAGELRERLEEAGVHGATCATVHATAWRQVRALWQLAGLQKEPQLMASSWGFVRDSIARTLGRSKADTATVTDVAGEIEWGRAWLLDPTAYQSAAEEHGRTCALAPEEIVQVWRQYTAMKAEQGVVDFADVLELAASMMDIPAVAERVRPKWSAFFLDEYQDIDHGQQRLVDAWVGDRKAITVTGDPEQAIFGFKGGDPALLMGFSKKHPDARVVHLTNNYRSTPAVVEWVNALTLVKRPPLVGHKRATTRPSVVCANDERSEEQQLVSQLRDWKRGGVPWEEMAVLFRFNATAARIEGALSSANIPYQTAGQVRFFERQEVRAVLVPFGQRARNTPGANGVACLLEAAESTGWDEDAPPQGAGAARSRWEAVLALVTLVRDDFDGLDAAGLLVELQRRAKSAKDVPMAGVTLATIHASKGLEWDAVWIAGAVEGQLPSAYATTDLQINEEQHLLYVAVSRARQHLVLSWSQRRQNNWRAERSRFLALLPGQAYVPSGKPRAKGAGTARRSGTARSGAGAKSYRGSTGFPGAGRSPSGGAYNNPSGTESSHEDATGAPTTDLSGFFECGKCGRRLTGAAARTAKRCSAACLDGEELARHAVLDAWRTARGAELGVEPAKVATDRGIFTAAVLGSSAAVLGFSVDAGPAPF